KSPTSTQRHLARAMEDQKRNAPLTWVGALGSILSWRTKSPTSTQRHLARAMEDQKRNAPLTWVGALGSIL
ncbi:hypothetical protein C0U44_32270, partial [Klebsiella pneumoniae]